ncbi:MAG: S9 family peptidase [Acidobacteriota bacterium]
MGPSLRVLSVLVLLSLRVSLPSAAAQPGEAAGLTPHDVARIRQVTAAVISPDGRRAAFILSVPRVPGNDEDGRPWTELHVIDLDTGTQRPFVTGKVEVASIVWTPDSQTILFVSRRPGDETRCLYGIDLAGGEARRLLALETDISAYSVGLAATGALEVAVLAEEPLPKEVQELKNKGFRQQIYEEDWQPKRLWVAELPGGKPERRDLPGSGVRVIYSPVPGSDVLAVTTVPRPLVDDVYMRQSVAILAGERQVPVENRGKLEGLFWSPDGRRLALISGADLHDPHAGKVALVDAATGALSHADLGDESSVSDVAWRDSERLLVLEAVGVWTRLRELDLRSSSLRTLLGGGGPILTSLSLSRDGRRAVALGHAPDHPSEVFFLEDPFTEARRLTWSNPWLKDRKLGRQEVVRFKARDGLELEGMLIHPLDREDGRLYPLILTVHGGPESHYSNGWLTSYSSPGQMAAARGLGVFYPNYRGSTGRGTAFAKLGQADAAGREFDDLIDGVDHVIRLGWVDPARVGVTGGSYGGYATAWCSTYYSDRFAAGVMFVGISNKISKVGTTDIPDEEYLVHALKRPWEDWEFFLRRSPVYYSDRHRTPLLILHGADDPRVNVGQSRELYRHLRLRNQAPVRLVLYPGEEHGNQKAAARLDYSLRMLQWFEHYLIGPGGDPPPATVEYQLEALKSEP